MTTATVTKAPPVHLSLSLRKLLIDQFDEDALRHLAALKAAESPRRLARRRLSTAKAEELAEMLTLGKIPTYGWWSRAL